MEEMDKQLNEDKVKGNSAQAISALNALLDKYIKTDLKQANLLSYWLKDYSTFLKKEATFNPRSMRKYKRGEVIKAHLGYNIGCEEGGLHYCVVLDNNNFQSSGIITVIPLTSVKEHKDISRLRYGEVYLGSDLRDKIEEKLSFLVSDLYRRLEHATISDDDISLNLKNASELRNLFDTANGISKELSHMKNGSIALVSQITTISKIRIYDPKTNNDALAKIKLSDASLTAIDDKLKELYTYRK